LPIAHLPDRSVAIFAEKEAAIFCDCDSDRSTPNISLLSRKLVAGVKAQIERCRMRLHEHVGNDSFVSKLGMFSLVTRIDMVADIKPGPAIKPAGFYTADVIGRQIIAEFIPLVCAHPELVTAGVKCDPDSVSNSPG